MGNAGFISSTVALCRAQAQPVHLSHRQTCWSCCAAAPYGHGILEMWTSGVSCPMVARPKATSCANVGFGSAAIQGNGEGSGWQGGGCLIVIVQLYSKVLWGENGPRIMLRDLAANLA